MKMKLIPMVAGLAFIAGANAQTIYVPNGTSGIGTSSNLYIGIGTNNTPSHILQVVGKPRFDLSTSTNAGNGRMYLTRTSSYNYECLISFGSGGVSTYDWAMGTYASGNNSISNTDFIIAGYSGTAGRMITLKQDGTTIIGAANNERVFFKSNGTVGIGVSGPEATLHIGGNLKLGDPNYNGRNWTINSQNWMDGGDFFINPDKTTDGTDDNTKGIRISRTTGNFTVGMYGGMTSVTTGRTTGLQNGPYSGNMYLGFNASCDGQNNWNTIGDGTNNGGSVIWNNTGGELVFSLIPTRGGTGAAYTTPQTVNSQYVNDHRTMMMHWNSTTNTGQVNIGPRTLTSGPHTDYRLSVDGKLLATEIYVTNTGWADYVFDDNYKLMALDSLKEFIKINDHLPNVPTTEEIKINGNNTGETDRILLEKIEELTLYILQLEARIKELEK